MGIQVPPVTMGAMCECGRGQVPSNLVVCWSCLDDRRAAFWEIWEREHAVWQAAEDTTRDGRLWELFPVDPDAVKCGLRTDLPKRDRVHKYAELGYDPRHAGDGRTRMTRIRACWRCGHDRQGG